MEKKLIFSVITMVCVSVSLFFDLPVVFGSARTALVIGNGRYRSSPLGNPVNDANDIAKALKNLGFDVILRIDADKKAMVKGINLFAKRLSRSEIGIFYFAGHGIQIDNHNYLIPVNAGVESESDVEFEGINAGRILGKMKEAGNRLNIVILDACRNNPFARSFRSSAKGLAKMDAPPGTIIAYATSPGSVASDGQGRNGIYTGRLLKNLQNPDLAVQEVFNQTGLDVMAETGRKQVPWISSTPVPEFYLAAGSRQHGQNIVQPAKNKTAAVPAPSSSKSLSRRHPLDINTLLAKAETEKTRKERKLAKEKQRKTELKQEIEKYNLLINNYGHQYKDQAWQAICNDFPALTNGLDSGDVTGLKHRAGLLEPGDVWTEPVTGMEFVWVPKGCFEMGNNSSDADPDEQPVHKVCVDGFWLGKYEVTQGQWKKIMHNNPSNFKNKDNYPVERVSWNDAKKFISQLNRESGHKFALPTEAQWEYAAKSGGKNQKYSGGNDVGRFAWYDSNSGDHTHPVGTKSPNGLGIYDMSGNVWEWCEDIYDTDVYSKHVLNNPVVESGGSFRVYRGGSWFNYAGDVRCALRFWDSASYTDCNLGFRLIRKN